jgi:hypothetical protein
MNRIFGGLVALLLFTGISKADPPNIFNSCSTDVKQTVDLLHEEGYQSFVKSIDLNDKTILHQFVYDMQTDRVMDVIITFKDETYKEATKICLGYVGVTPDGNGSAFHDFILRNELNNFNAAEDAHMKEKADHLKTEHDPAPTDPSKL